MVQAPGGSVTMVQAPGGSVTMVQAPGGFVTMVQAPGGSVTIVQAPGGSVTIVCCLKRNIRGYGQRDHITMGCGHCGTVHSLPSRVRAIVSQLTFWR